MPEYKSHKTVRALKIASVQPRFEQNNRNRPCAEVVLSFEDKGFANMTLPGEYWRKHQPQPGGYLVVYEDGYMSFSPAEAFESGYTPMQGEGGPYNDESPEEAEKQADDFEVQKADGYDDDFEASIFTGQKEPPPYVPDDYPDLVDYVAARAHEANRLYCQAIGDNSQPDWADAPEWQKESVRNGVKFHVAFPDAGPAASHENWLAEKEWDGWKYGPVKDPEKKEHPCFLPYDQLPLEQRRKDEIFIAVVEQYRDDLDALE